jgi:hypothetical protein
MIRLYCRDHHGSRDQPCTECARLLGYAEQRLDRCPFGADKPTCARCTVHCYRRDMRERVRTVMRYSGPRMLRRHPYLAVAHLLDRRRTPEAGKARETGSDGDPAQA